MKYSDYMKNFPGEFQERVKEAGKKVLEDYKNSSFTYKDLLEELQNWNEQNLSRTVTFYDCISDEYFPCDIDVVVESDVLDEGHPIITRLNRNK